MADNQQAWEHQTRAWTAPSLGHVAHTHTHAHTRRSHAQCCWQKGAFRLAIDREPTCAALRCGVLRGVLCCAVLQEYTRAAHVLSGLESPVALFLRCYALFLAGEKQKE